MLVSLKWLRDYLELPATVDIDDLAHRLTMASAEVEGIRRTGAQWDRALVTVGAVLTVEPHPNADRLRLATVNYGGAQPQQVVCGAPNVAAGQRIAFAREGATLFDGPGGASSTLKRAKIRGVESAGMVLSERELGLSDAHEGILVLPPDATPGTPLADYLGDVVLDVHVWPNRADMMSMLGVARELGAILGLPAREPPEQYREDGPPAAEAVAVAIDDPALCARYIAAVIEGVTVGDSPRWLQDRLRAAGQRPINNVVDVTNYVMLELGQPLHAFDLAQVRGRVTVRTARPGERLRTLDGQDRELTVDTLLITDERGPLALAGVMGGQDTEVSPHTSTILLEAARFDPASIRRTSTRLRLRSESSSRFERGLSPELALHAARRATRLLVELCGGRARRGLVDVYPRPQPAPRLHVTSARLDTVIGFAVPTPEVEHGLRALGFEVAARGDGFEVQPPWWRTDVAIPDDVAEEVVRIAGYDRLPATTLAGHIPPPEPRPLVEARERLREGLVAAGLHEVITYSLTSQEMLRRVLPPEQLATLRPLRLSNPLTADRELLRPTLRHALLEAMDRNLRAGAGEVALFEIARVYLRREGAAGPLPEEREMAAGALCGFEPDRWGRATDRRLDFFDAKSALEQAFAQLGVTPRFVAGEEFGMLPGRVARLRLGGEDVGVVGVLHPDTLARFEIDQPVVLFELDLARLLPQVPPRHQAVPVPRFPAVEQDLALVVNVDVPAGALRALIERSPLVAAVAVFDVYRGEQLPADKKSVAFAIRYQATDRTLTSEDANREQARIVARLEREFGATPRA
ncbi:MAG: phenylalanine--tRNA ligase subunit beta [Dehalococcoidia bacterium]|nr:phenylalanine--tRNA ligase subunit beta [Dehalococcoidia bacterium]